MPASSLNALSPCRNYYIDISSNGVVNLWSTSTGKLLHQYGEPDRLTTTYTASAWFQPHSEEKGDSVPNGGASNGTATSNGTGKKRKREMNVVMGGSSTNGATSSLGLLALGKSNGGITVYDLNSGSTRAHLGTSSDSLGLLSKKKKKKKKNKKSMTNNGAATTFGTAVTALAFGPTGENLYACNLGITSLQCWRLATQSLQTTYDLTGTDVSSTFTESANFDANVITLFGSDETTSQHLYIAIASKRVAIFRLESPTTSTTATTSTESTNIGKEFAFVCEITGHAGFIDAMDFSADGKKLITVSTSDRSPSVWDLGDRLSSQKSRPHSGGDLASSSSQMIRSPFVTLSTGGESLKYGVDIQSVKKFKPAKGDKPSRIMVETHVAIVTKDNRHRVLIFRVPTTLTPKQKASGKPLTPLTTMRCVDPSSTVDEVQLTCPGIKLTEAASSVRNRNKFRCEASCVCVFSQSFVSTPLFHNPAATGTPVGTSGYLSWTKVTGTMRKAKPQLQGKKYTKNVTKDLSIKVDALIGQRSKNRNSNNRKTSNGTSEDESDDEDEQSDDESEDSDEAASQNEKEVEREARRLADAMSVPSAPHVAGISESRPELTGMDVEDNNDDGEDSSLEGDGDGQDDGQDQESEEDEGMSLGEKAERFMEALRHDGVLDPELDDDEPAISMEALQEAKIRAKTFLQNEDRGDRDDIDENDSMADGSDDDKDDREENALGGRQSKGKSRKINKPMSASLARVLQQALQVSDNGMLEYCLRNEDQRVINGTVQRLAPTYILPLLRAVISKLEARPRRAKILVVWIRSVMKYHAGFLCSGGNGGNSNNTTPALQRELGALHASIEQRLRVFKKLMMLQGKLDLLLNASTARLEQAGYADDTEQEEATDETPMKRPLMVYQES
eukprot:g792.t1